MYFKNLNLCDAHAKPCLRGWSTQILTKMCNEVIFPRTLKTSYFLYLKSISGIFRVLTTLESTILENSIFCWQFDFEF